MLTSELCHGFAERIRILQWQHVMSAVDQCHLGTGKQRDSQLCYLLA